MWERSRGAEPRPRCGFRHLWLGCCVVCLGIASACPLVGAQEAPQTVDADTPPQTSSTAGTERAVSWRGLPKSFLQDQKDIWLFPVQLGKGRHWVPNCLTPRRRPTGEAARPPWELSSSERLRSSADDRWPIETPQTVERQSCGCRRVCLSRTSRVQTSVSR